MIKSILSSILLQIIFLATAYAQDPNIIIIHTPSNDSIQYAIDLQGNKLFELPPHHKINIDKSREDRGDIVFEHVYLYDTNRGSLVVRNEKNYYLIDAKGNKTAEIDGKYVAVSPAWDGFYKARIRKENKKDKAKFQYLDSKGKVAFEGRIFLQAPHFSEGKALVQNLDSSWEIIDNNGVSLGKVDKDISPYILKAGHFYNNRCLVQTKENKPEISSRHTRKFYYFNPKGEIVIDASESFGYRNHFAPSIFQKGSAYFQSGEQVIFFDTLGVETMIYDDITNVINREGNFIQLFNRSNQRIIIDRQGKQLDIPVKPSEMVTPDKVFGNYLKLYFTDRSTYKRGYKYVDLTSMKTAFESNGSIIYVLPNLLVMGNRKYPNDLYKLMDFEGNVLFKRQ